MSQAARPLSSTDPALVLRIVDGPDKGRTFSFDSDQVSIGRSQDCEVMLTDPKISRQHILIMRTRSGYLVRNTSQKDMFVNGQRAQESKVTTGSLVNIGDSHIRFEIQNSAGPNANSSNQGSHSDSTNHLAVAKPSRSTGNPSNRASHGSSKNPASNPPRNSANSASGHSSNQGSNHPSNNPANYLTGPAQYSPQQNNPVSSHHGAASSQPMPYQGQTPAAAGRHSPTPDIRDKSQRPSVNYNSQLDNDIASAQQGNKTFFYVVLGVGLLLGYVILSPNSPIGKKIRNPSHTSEVIDEEIQKLNLKKDDLIQLQIKSGKNTEQYRDAQAAFIIGLRDYREGNYKRAIISFNSALALFPNHELAQKYAETSRRKLQETIDQLMQDGRKYTEQNQFSLALASYKKAMILIEDREDQKFKEARARAEELELVIKGAF